MRSVNVADLKNNLGRYLKIVRQGEELLIRDCDEPIAKIVPLPADKYETQEMTLAAAGLLKLPEATLPDDFWSTPAPRVPMADLLAAIRAERDED